jgi:hypothetical protein
MTAPLGPNIPMVNLGNLYISGLNLTWLTTSTIQVSPGQCRDHTDQNDIQLPATITYGPTATPTTITPTYIINTAQSGALGLDILPVAGIAASTLYYVYAIGNSNNNSPSQPGFDPSNLPSVMLSLSASAPTLPKNYDMYRRIGCVRTDTTAAPSHIIPFFQEVSPNSARRLMTYCTDGIAALIALNAGTSNAYAAVVLTGLLPPLATTVVFRASLTPNAAGDSVTLRPTNALAGLQTTIGTAVMSGDVAAVVHVDMMEVLTGVTVAGVTSIDYKLTAGTDAVTLVLQSYFDEV